MPDCDTFVLFGAVYTNPLAAQLDYDAVKMLSVDFEPIDDFDAAIIEKRDDGKVEIVKKHEQPTRNSGWRGAGLGLATGIVIALFPAAGLGSGLLAATTGTGAALGAVAGHVVAGMSRSDLKELGEHLDEGQSGLLVVAAADDSSRVEQALKNADKIVRKELHASHELMEQAVAEAGSESR